MNKLGPLHIIKNTGTLHNATVIFLHGSGDTGKGILDWVKFLNANFSLPHVKFLFPTAPRRPYTFSGGERSTVWFDRTSLSPDSPEHNETIESTKDNIKEIINAEVESGISVNRIVVGGFSMGGALSFHMGYRYVDGLAGVFALSSFLNNDSAVYKNIKSLGTPLYMCHGDCDSMVPIQWGKQTFDKLSELGVKGEFTTIKNTFHELKKDEIAKLLKWIEKVLPSTR